MEKPPKEIPNELRRRFTLDGRIPVFPFYFDGTVASGKPISWLDGDTSIYDYLGRFNRENIDGGKSGKEPYPGASRFFCKAFDKYSVKNKDVAVIGSIKPWIEAILINYGAKQVTTVEFNVPICDHPKIKTIHYNDFIKSEKKYDMIISYSSIEHCGLGRYGDPIDPDGDLKAMAEIKKRVKPDGFLFFGQPIGKDCICWNAHRIYGPIRLPLLFKGLKVVEWIGMKKDTYPSLKKFKQPVIVLKLESSDRA